MINEYIYDLKQEFKGYNTQKFKQDLLAGLTVTAVALPLALAFGVGCGATASAGLITAIISGIVIASFSGASFQISGPTGAMTAILILLFQKYGLNGVWLAGAMSGVILIIAGLLKFGKLVSFIPSPVVTGFTSGIALTIAIGQIDNFFGIKSAEAESTAIKFLRYFQTGINPNWSAVLLGCIVIAIMILWPKKWNAIIPSSLVGLMAALVVQLIFHFDVAVIGEIPKTLLPENRLNLFTIDISSLKEMIIPALSIAALGMIESLLCGEVGSKMKGEKLNANRELIAQGIGNIIIPFFGGVPATAAIARTSVAIKSGCQTRLVSIFHSVGLIISMFVLSPIMSRIPLSALAGVLMVTAWRMNEWEDIKYIFSKRFIGAILKYLITMLATIIFDLTQAILIGVVFASFMFLVKISNMEISIQEVDQKRLREKSGMNISKPLSHIRVVYFTGPIFFATVKQLNTQLSDINNISVLILSMRGVPLIDTSGVQALEELYHQLKKKNCQLMLCGLQPNVKEMLKKSNLAEHIGEDMVFWSADEAIIAAQDMVVA